MQLFACGMCHLAAPMPLALYRIWHIVSLRCYHYCQHSIVKFCILFLLLGLWLLMFCLYNKNLAELGPRVQQVKKSLENYRVLKGVFRYYLPTRSSPLWQLQIKNLIWWKSWYRTIYKWDDPYILNILTFEL